jgi:hypothetical protein
MRNSNANIEGYVQVVERKAVEKSVEKAAYVK